MYKFFKLSFKFLGLLGVSLFYIEPAWAKEAQDIGDVFKNLAGQYTDIGFLIVGVSAISGLGFGIAAAYKFKQYKDNPTQIPIGTPVALLIVSVLMWFMPSLVSPAAKSLFGGGVVESGTYGMKQTKTLTRKVNTLFGRQGLGDE
jgi:intracellular multiplication protein IcmD